jgi:hypothetical protein
MVPGSAAIRGHCRWGSGVTRYSHRQRSRLTTAVGLLFAVVMLAAALMADPLPTATRAAFVVAALSLSWLMMTFSTLTVEITDRITVAFGRGWPARRIDPADVMESRVVRNSPLHGLGIRWIRGGYLWNVWGLDAVELLLVSGRRFRIGTDDAEALHAAVRSVTTR